MVLTSLHVALRSGRGVARRSSQTFFLSSHAMSTTTTNTEEEEKALKNQERRKKAGKGPFLSVLGVNTLTAVDRNHLGWVIELQKDHVSELWPEPVKEDVTEDLELFETPSFVVREPYIQIQEKMALLESEDPSERAKAQKQQALLVTGKRGSGKSVTLAKAVMKARSSGWLTMYAPDCRFWVTDKGAIDRGTGTAAMIVPSKARPEMFTQPIGAQNILKNVKELHEKQLQDLPQRRKYKHTLYNMGDKPTLLGIVNRGLKSAVHACDALYDLRMEFGLVEEFPVLIAVDQINALYWPTCFYSAGTAIPPNKLVLAETFRCFDQEGALRPEHKLKRGLIVTAPTAKYGFASTPMTVLEHYTHTGYMYYKPFEARKGDLDQKVTLGEDVAEISIPPLNSSELRSLVINLKKQKVVENIEVIHDEVSMNALRVVTGGVIKQIRDTILRMPQV